MFWKKKKKTQNKETTQLVKPNSQISKEAFDIGYNQNANESLDNLIRIAEWNIQNAIKVVPKGFATDSLTQESQKEAYNLQFGQINVVALNYFISTSSFIGYQAMALIAQHWLVNKACFQKVRDSMRRGFTLATNDGKRLDPKKAKEIINYDKKIKLEWHMINAVGMNNVFGIRHILFKHKNPNFDYSKPFNPDAFKNGNYDGIREIDPYWITPNFNERNLSDPTSLNFYDPDVWLIRGKEYHKSHFIILRGEEVSDILKPSYRYGGVSMTQRVYERCYNAERTANESPQLVMTKRLNARKIDLSKAVANREDFISKIKMANSYRDNHGWLIYGKDEEIVQLETNLSQLAETINNQYEIIANIADVPVSRFIGNGNQGFGGADTDDDYYLGSCASVQKEKLDPIARAHYERLLPSIDIGIDEIDIIWNPLKVMSEKEIADMNYVKSQTAVNQNNIGSIDAFDERERLISDQYSQYSGITQMSREELEFNEDDDKFITQNNNNNGGQNKPLDVNGKEQNTPSRNSVK